MKLILILAIAASSYAAKLDRTYLPPPGANSAGGSPGSLSVPHGTRPSGPSFGAPIGQAPSSFGNQAINRGFAPNSIGFQGSRGPSHDSAVQPTSHYDQRPSVNGFEAQTPQNIGQQGIEHSNSFPGQQGNVRGGNGPQRNFNEVSPSNNQDFADRPIHGQVYSQPERAQAAQDRAAEIIRYDHQIDGDSFAYNFETSNGISAEENGVATNGVQAQGAFSYTGDDGQVYSITYTADENGYQPHGDHLPTPPPIPEEILKSVEDNARAAAAGTQEGAYHEDDSEGYSSPQYNVPRPGSPQKQYIQGSRGGNDAPNSQYGAPNEQFRPQSQQYSSLTHNAPVASNVGQKPSQHFDRQSGQSQSGSTRPQFGPSSAADQYNAPSNQQSTASNFSPSGFQQRPSSNQIGSGSSSGYQYNRPTTTHGFDQSKTAGSGSSPQYPSPSSQNSQNNNANGRPHHEDARIQGPSSSASNAHVPHRNSQGSGFNTPNAQSNSYNGPNAQRPQQSSHPGSHSPRLGSYDKSSSPLNQSGRPVGHTSISSFNNTPQSSTGSQPSGFGVKPQSTGSKMSVPSEAPYQYNPPSRPGSSSQVPAFVPLRPNGQGATNGEVYSGPRQPPSFSPEEGYKY